MLGYFALSITFAAERVELIVRDVPVAVFFQGYPVVPPLSPDGEDRWGWKTNRDIEHWMIELLARAIVQPRLTREELHRLGEEARTAAVGYLRAVGWITQGGLDAIAEEPLGVDVKVEGPAYGVRPFIEPVPAMVRSAITDVGMRTGISPCAIWQGPISEFLFNWRMLMAEVVAREAVAE